MTTLLRLDSECVMAQKAKDTTSVKRLNKKTTQNIATDLTLALTKQNKNM